MSVAIEEKPFCPSCFQHPQRLWRCEAQGSQYKGAYLCYSCCEKELMKAREASVARLEAMTPEERHKQAQKDVEDLWGKE